MAQISAMILIIIVDRILQTSVQYSDILAVGLLIHSQLKLLDIDLKLL